MYHFVYETTNKINGKKYIGKHSSLSIEQWKNPEYRKLMSLKMKDRVKNLWKDPSFRKSKSGENAPSSKLTEEQVIDIKKRLQKEETQSSIAKIYGVSRASISKIKHNKTWKHVKGI